jgi:hypothetical protein
VVLLIFSVRAASAYEAPAARYSARCADRCGRAFILADEAVMAGVTVLGRPVGSVQVLPSTPIGEVDRFFARTRLGATVRTVSRVRSSRVFFNHHWVFVWGLSSAAAMIRWLVAEHTIDGSWVSAIARKVVDIRDDKDTVVVMSTATIA